MWMTWSWVSCSQICLTLTRAPGNHSLSVTEQNRCILSCSLCMFTERKHCVATCNQHPVCNGKISKMTMNPFKLEKDEKTHHKQSWYLTYYSLCFDSIQCLGSLAERMLEMIQLVVLWLDPGPRSRTCIKEHAQWQRDLSMRIRQTTIRIAGIRTYPKLAEQVHGSRPCLRSDLKGLPDSRDSDSEGRPLVTMELPW